MLARVVRRTAVTCLVMAGVALILAPSRPLIAGGVIGGGVLVGLALWALSGMVTTLGVGDETGEIRTISRRFALVKFFTRHGMLALAAYAMMVRLHLDPVGMLIGVTSVVLAAAAEAVRRR